MAKDLTTAIITPSYLEVIKHLVSYGEKQVLEEQENIQIGEIK